MLEEGAARSAALLGLIRLVESLAAMAPARPVQHIRRDTGAELEQQTLRDRACDLVVDSGTGTSAVGEGLQACGLRVCSAQAPPDWCCAGLALGVALLSLPWRVHGVCLAGEQAYYEEQQQRLLQGFFADEGYASCLPPGAADVSLPLLWRPRLRPRRFGSVLPGEVEACRKVGCSCVHTGRRPTQAPRPAPLCAGGPKPRRAAGPCVDAERLGGLRAAGGTASCARGHCAHAAHRRCCRAAGPCAALC